MDGEELVKSSMNKERDRKHAGSSHSFGLDIEELCENRLKE